MTEISWSKVNKNSWKNINKNIIYVLIFTGWKTSKNPLISALYNVYFVEFMVEKWYNIDSRKRGKSRQITDHLLVKNKQQLYAENIEINLKKKQVVSTGESLSLPI